MSLQVLRACSVQALRAVVVLGCAAWPTVSVAAAPTYDSGGSGEANRLPADAGRAAYHGRFSEAIADDSKALALMPSDGGALAQRSQHYRDAGLYDEAQRDLDRVTAMHPDDMPLGMARVELAIRRGDGATALSQLQKALKLPQFSEWHHGAGLSAYSGGSGDQFRVTGHMESRADMYASIAEQLLHHDDASLADMQRMMQLEVQYPEYILARYCYLAAVAGLAESAELACKQSIQANSHDIGQYDSLGFAYLRMKQWGKAIIAYNKAITDRPDLTLSLYGRGVAKRALGDTAGGNADISAATSNEPDIANIMKRLGAPSA